MLTVELGGGDFSGMSIAVHVSYTFTDAVLETVNGVVI
jgi:hypothetical protein